jgi:hypothetical protein
MRSTFISLVIQLNVQLILAVLYPKDSAAIPPLVPRFQAGDEWPSSLLTAEPPNQPAPAGVQPARSQGPPMQPAGAPAGRSSAVPTMEMADFPFVSASASKPPSLAMDDVRHFCEHGFVILRGFYSAAEVATRRTASAQLLARAVEPDFSLRPRADTPNAVEPVGGWGGVTVGICPWHRAAVAAGKPLGGDATNPGRVTYINDVHAVCPEMERHMRSPRLLRALSCLLGDDIDGYQQAFVVKPPRSNIEYHGWHQVSPDNMRQRPPRTRSPHPAPSGCGGLRRQRQRRRGRLHGHVELWQSTDDNLPQQLRPG